MNGGGPSGQGRCDDVGNVEVAFAAGGLANADRLIGQLNMEGMAINRGMYSHGGNAHFFAGTNDAERNFPTISDQNFGKIGAEEGV
jgi:hypothetical protein